MLKQIFINLPVADVARATAFYEALGLEQDARFSGDHASALRWSDSVMVMVMAKEAFAGLTPKPVVDATTGLQLAIALSLDSRAEVDALVEKAAAAGGTIDASPPEDLGFMYSRDFADLDGHSFGPFFMEPQAGSQLA
jgi:uncharacterized protein